jgi:predicted secreted Zn-dependent protease
VDLGGARVVAVGSRLCVFLLALIPALAMARDSFRIEYFTIRGSTAAELRADLKRLGPVGETGMRGDAYTEYRIAWQSSMTFQDGSCRAHDVNVDLDVTMLLPRWEKPPSPAAELVQAWDGFSAALREHEDGHHRLAVEAAKEVRRKLGKRIRAASCDSLKVRLNDIVNAVLSEYRDKQADYDEKTDYGRKQTSGAL